MTEQIKDPAATSPDLTNYVPKDAHEKAIKEAEVKVAGLKKELDTKKLELLDPEYLNWRESKQTKPALKTLQSQAGGDDRVAKLEAKIEELSESLQVTKQVAERLYFDRELELTKQKYTDFDEYKEDVEKILTASKAPITYAQAYLMAKDEKQRTAKPEDKGEKKATPASEKPSNTVQAKVLQQKEYKTEEEANAATLAQLRDKFPNMGDTI